MLFNATKGHGSDLNDPLLIQLCNPARSPAAVVLAHLAAAMNPDNAVHLEVFGSLFWFFNVMETCTTDQLALLNSAHFLTMGGIYSYASRRQKSVKFVTHFMFKFQQ